MQRRNEQPPPDSGDSAVSLHCQRSPSEEMQQNLVPPCPAPMKVACQESNISRFYGGNRSTSHERECGEASEISSLSACPYFFVGSCIWPVHNGSQTGEWAGQRAQPYPLCYSTCSLPPRHHHRLCCYSPPPHLILSIRPCLLYGHPWLPAPYHVALP